MQQRANRMFNRPEVQISIVGLNSPIDLKDLREHTNYSGLYDDGEISSLGSYLNVNLHLDDETVCVPGITSAIKTAYTALLSYCFRRPYLFIVFYAH